MTRTIRRAAILWGAATIFTIGNSAYAQQSEISYDYVGGAVLVGEVVDEDFTVYGVNGSFSIGDSFFVTASYGGGESDDEFTFLAGTSEIEIDGFSVGFGYHTSISSNTDFVTSLEYFKVGVEVPGFDDDTNGYAVNLGLRSMVLSNLELAGGIDYSDGSDVDGEVGLGVNAKWFVTPSFALILGYTDADESSGVSVGLRYNF